MPPSFSPFSPVSLLSPPFPSHPSYKPLTVRSHPTSITAQKFKEPNWPHLSQCWMQMEFLLLREVQLVTPAAPTPSIYCLKAKPACAALDTIEPRYEASCRDKEGTAVKWPLHWPHTLSASFSFLSITFFSGFFFILHLAFILPHSIPFTHSPHSCLLILPAHTHAHLLHKHEWRCGGHSERSLQYSLKQPGQTWLVNKGPKWGSMHKTWSAACCRNELLLHNCISEP